jgi:hypothetical protein
MTVDISATIEPMIKIVGRVETPPTKNLGNFFLRTIRLPGYRYGNSRFE